MNEWLKLLLEEVRRRREEAREQEPAREPVSPPDDAAERGRTDPDRGRTGDS